MRDVKARATALAVPVVLALGLALAACANGSGEMPSFAIPGVGPPELPRPGLFISPFGEPFVSEPGAPWPTADWFAGADQDRDSVVTQAEFAADGQRWFRRLDLDGNGRIDGVELTAYETSLHRFGGGEGSGGFRGGPGGRPGDGGGLSLGEPQEDGRRGPGGRPGYASEPRPRQLSYGRIAEAGFFDLPEPVKAADVNIDQRVSTQEWAQATDRWFHALDPDQDGKLILASLPITPLQARGGVSRRGRGGPGRP